MILFEIRTNIALEYNNTLNCYCEKSQSLFSNLMLNQKSQDTIKFIIVIYNFIFLLVIIIFQNFAKKLMYLFFNCSN